MLSFHILSSEDLLLFFALYIHIFMQLVSLRIPMLIGEKGTYEDVTLDFGNWDCFLTLIVRLLHQRGEFGPWSQMKHSGAGTRQQGRGAPTDYQHGGESFVHMVKVQILFSEIVWKYELSASFINRDKHAAVCKAFQQLRKVPSPSPFPWDDTVLINSVTSQEKKSFLYTFAHQHKYDLLFSCSHLRLWICITRSPCNRIVSSEVPSKSPWSDLNVIWYCMNIFWFISLYLIWLIWGKASKQQCHFHFHLN